MANTEKRLCWAQRVTPDDTAFGYVGRCPHRKIETEEPGKVNTLMGILKIFSLGMIRGKVTCTLPEGSSPPKLCKQGKDYLFPSRHK